MFLLIFQRGYKLTSTDIESYRSHPHPEYADVNADVVLLNAYNNLKERRLCNLIYYHPKAITVIESAKHQQIIGTRLKGWSAFAMNIMISNKRYWKYFEPLSIIMDFGS